MSGVFVMNEIKLPIGLRLELLKLSDLQDIAERVLAYSEVIRYCSGQIDIIQRRANVPSIEVVENKQSPPD